MQAKEYLGQVSRINRMIKNKVSEIAQLKEIAINISAIDTEERVQTSPDFDKIGKMFVRIDEEEDKLNSLIFEYIELKNKIISQIEGIKEETFYCVLFSRYVENKTFEKIAIDMQYSFRQITRLHGKALLAFDKMYGENIKTCPRMS